MPRNRVPQNSASSSRQRIFSDLQAVYQKIIQTNGASFPFRAKDSRRSLHTAPASLRNRQPLTVANSVFSSRSPSVCGSVEEIIIKPLQFTDRLTYTSCSSHYPLSSHDGKCQSDRESNPSSAKFNRIRSGSLPAPVEYSDQSIRYVTEQVSLEQARQLKLRSNVRQHRVDRRYFVSGSKVHIQKQAFKNIDNDALQLNSDKKLDRVNPRHRLHVPRIKGGTKRDLGLKENGIHYGVCGTLLKLDADSTDPLTSTDINAVAIPTASNGSKPPASDHSDTINSDEHFNQLDSAT